MSNIWGISYLLNLDTISGQEMGIHARYRLPASRMADQFLSPSNIPGPDI